MLHKFELKEDLALAAGDRLVLDIVRATLTIERNVRMVIVQIGEAEPTVEVQPLGEDRVKNVEVTKRLRERLPETLPVKEKRASRKSRAATFVSDNEAELMLLMIEEQLNKHGEMSTNTLLNAVGIVADPKDQYRARNRASAVLHHLANKGLLVCNRSGSGKFRRNCWWRLPEAKTITTPPWHEATQTKMAV